MVEKFEVRVPIANVADSGWSLSREVREWLHLNVGSNISDMEHVPWDYMRDEIEQGEWVALFLFLDKEKAALFRLFYG